MILLSSSTRGSKLTLIYWYFYPPPLEIRNWSRFTDTSILFRPRFEADLDLLILLSFSVRDLKLILIYWYFYPPLLEARSWSWFTDTSILLRPRFEVIFLPSSAWGLEWFCSSSARGSKLILVEWYSYPFSPKVRSWSLTVTCSLYWTYTWRPVKLGSVLVLHLKASQTCNSNFIICLLT